MDKHGHRTHWTMPLAPWKRHPAYGLTLYCAGPMRGIEDRNRPAFIEARRLCNQLGVYTRSPLDVTSNLSDGFKFDPTGKPHVWEPGERNVFREDLKFIIDPTTDGILMLGGWENSEGATFERQLALIVGAREFRVLYAEDDTMFDIYEVKP